MYVRIYYNGGFFNTELRNFPLYCPKCKKETSINAQDMKVTLAEHK